MTDNWIKIKCLGIASFLRHITDYNAHNCRVFSFTTWSLRRSWWSCSIEYCWSIIMMKLIFYAAAVAALLFNLNFSSSFFSWYYQKICVQSKGTHGQFFFLFSFAITSGKRREILYHETFWRWNADGEATFDGCI